MEKGLSLAEIQDLIRKAEQAFRHEECNTCECFLGYVVQLEFDADNEGKAYLQDYQSERNPIHSCLGCDPCSPGILYSNYLRKKSSGTG
jgi:hypothetical protein